VAKDHDPVHAVITKIDRMETGQGDSLFLKVDVGGETVRVFSRPEEMAERLEASGYDIPAARSKLAPQAPRKASAFDLYPVNDRGALWGGADG